MLEYYAGIITQRVENNDRRRDCDVLLIQSRPEDAHADHGWKKIWEGGRPGDRSERYSLYHRMRR